MLRLGVDVGGTKTEIVVIDDGGGELLRRRVPTARGAYGPALQALAELVLDAEREAGAPCSVGVGVPGAIASSGELRNADNTPYDGRCLGRDLGALLRREVRVANDANCFALSEATDGAARGARLVFGAVLGTGAGGGIVFDGRLRAGHEGRGAEWGHNPLPWPAADELPGPECYCGRRGCIEQWVSGTALARDHAASSGRQLSAEAIVAAAVDGDAACDATLARHERRLARALAHVVNLLAPDAIVLGGGLSNIERLYATLPGSVASFVYSDAVDLRIVRAAHGAASGVRGAALLGR
jgi:fructokinase